MKTYRYPLFCLVILLASCDQRKEIIADIYQPRYAHEAYTHILKTAGADQSRLGQLWLQAATAALSSPVHIETPYATDIYVSDDEATAFGYRFEGRRGQIVTISLTIDAPDEGDVYMDLYRLSEEEAPIHFASADTTYHKIEFEPKTDQAYVLRIQPELLRRGRYRLEIRSAAALAFPVTGKSKNAIGSLFGAPRDAGRRIHHGVDIFARRHTPIIAPCDGYIRSTEPNELGGEVIWMRDDEREQTLYFAHLHEVLVDPGTYVNQGDTIATVGNTGNAKTTSPHLHFGIYNNGPIDPYNFIVDPRMRFKTELAKVDLIGQNIRTNKTAQLKSLDPSTPTLSLIEDQLLHVRGTSGMYYHVELPDGKSGLIGYRDIEKLSRPLRQGLPQRSDLLDEPTESSLVLAASTSLSEAKAMALHGDYTYIYIGEQYSWVKS